MSELAFASPHVTSFRILAVVVLYKCSLSTSSTCRSLLNQHGSCGNRIAILAYDNSPEPVLETPPQGWTYFSDSKNGGLSKAYNHSLSLAQDQGCDWLLLLDQDSVLPPNFLVTLFAAVDGIQDRVGIAAIVPKVFSGTRQVSPIRPRPGREVPIDLHECVASGWVSAINSAACIRTTFLASIGGFAKEYWLDYLDYWLFLKIYESGKQVFISKARVHHGLSVANFECCMSYERYQNLLAAEMRFTNNHLGPVWRIVLAIRLLMRTAKHLILGHDTCFARATFRAAQTQTLSIVPGLGA
jgi:GT2 family glycosyltransferase